MPMMLYEATGRVKEVKPNASKEGIVGWINRRIRNVLDNRTWSDQLKIGAINIPNQYTTGTVTLTPGQIEVVGVGTAWPVADLVNTTLSDAVVESPGYVEITPASMGSIEAGMRLRLEAENVGVVETIIVIETTLTSFFARCRYQHNVNATLTASSLAGRQFRTNAYTYTLAAVKTATTLDLEVAFGGPAQNAVSYQIYKSYCSLGATAVKLRYAWDAIAGQPIGIEKNSQWITLRDPQRTSTGQALELATMPPNEGGIARWELWPTQLSVYQLAVIYVDGWPTLKEPNDPLPWFINPEVFIAGACADALRVKVIANMARQDPYWDPGLARDYEKDCADLLEQAIQSDQGRDQQFLQDYRDKLRSGGSLAWERNHAVSAPWPM